LGRAAGEPQLQSQWPQPIHLCRRRLRGNLSNDGSRTFSYDLENRLTSVGGSASMLLSYDPLGRLRYTNVSSVVTEFFYDGDRLVRNTTTPAAAHCCAVMCTAPASMSRSSGTRARG
jgi:hypothetical protein